jgi:aspartate beta-hydroxylase
MQAAKAEEKRLANEARLAERAGKISAKVAKTVKTTPAEADSYEALFSKATSAGPQAMAAAKKEAKKAESKAAVDKATLPDVDVKKALEEAKLTEAAAKKAKGEAEVAAKQEALDQKIAAQKSAEAAKIKVKEEMAEVEALKKQVRGN